MTAGKRMLLGFCCVLLAIALVGVLFMLPNAIRYGPRFALSMWTMLPLFLLFAVPGWVLALPFVLLFRNADGYRAWLILLIGTAIGPASIVTAEIAGRLRMLVASRHAAELQPVASSAFSAGLFNWQRDGYGIVMSLVIAFFTAAFYAALLRHFSREASSPKATDSDPPVARN